MLTPPDGFREDVLVTTLTEAWGIEVASIGYRPVGFGSHHWEAVLGDGSRRFVAVDDLVVKDDDGGVLTAALTAVGELGDHVAGLGIPPVSVGPIRTRDGDVLARIGDRFVVALYPFVVGESFEWGDFSSPEHRAAVLDLLVTVHCAPVRAAGSDTFELAHRDGLEAGLAGDVGDHGPYSAGTARLLAEHGTAIRRLLGRYDELVAQARSGAHRQVLTHGEPHPGNTMRTDAGWLLIDWETALLAPPERDLWHLDPGDGSMLARYERATGVRPDPAMLELYRIRWDLNDLGIDVGRFRRPHSGNEDDDASWRILSRLIVHIGSHSSD